MVRAFNRAHRTAEEVPVALGSGPLGHVLREDFGEAHLKHCTARSVATRNTGNAGTRRIS